MSREGGDRVRWYAKPMLGNLLHFLTEAINPRIAADIARCGCDDLRPAHSPSFGISPRKVCTPPRWRSAPR